MYKVDWFVLFGFTMIGCLIKQARFGIRERRAGREAGKGRENVNNALVIIADKSSSL